MPGPTIWLSTLGCAKNQVDSEKLIAMLSEAGYGWAEEPELADVVMVNTCAFIEEARAESVEVILELEDRKRADARSVVIGCMAQRFGSEVENALPEVDAMLGIDRYDELVGVLDGLTGWQPVDLRRRPVMDILHATGRPLSNLPYSHLKVAEGCDKPCTFCAIPAIRGKQRSPTTGGDQGRARRTGRLRSQRGRARGTGSRWAALTATPLRSTAWSVSTPARWGSGSSSSTPASTDPTRRAGF